MEKGRIRIPGGGTLCGFTVLLKTAHNLKLINCLFLEFPISYFQTPAGGGLQNPKIVKLWTKGKVLPLNPC